MLESTIVRAEDFALYGRTLKRLTSRSG